MKHSRVFSATAALLCVSACTAQEPLDPTGQWLHDRVMKAAQQDTLTGARAAQTPGTYRVLSLDDLDAPEAVKRQFRERIERYRHGVVRVEEGVIPSEKQFLVLLPRERHSEAVLRQRLPAPPSTLQRTALGQAQMIGMEPSGLMDGVKSSGLSRFYRVNGVGIVEFNEENFRVPGTLIESFVEAQNTSVKGVPAQIEREVDARNRGRVTLSWAGKNKQYTLIATGDDDVERKERVLLEIAGRIDD